MATVQLIVPIATGTKVHFQTTFGIDVSSITLRFSLVLSPDDLVASGGPAFSCSHLKSSQSREMQHRAGSICRTSGHRVVNCYDASEGVAEPSLAEVAMRNGAESDFTAGCGSE